MNYKLLLLVVVLLFIGANLMCSCCRYPVFDYITSGFKEGNTNKDPGRPGSNEAVETATNDMVEMTKKMQPTPSAVAATNALNQGSSITNNTDGMKPMKEGNTGIQNLFNTGKNLITGGGSDKPKEGFSSFQNGWNVITGKSEPRQEAIPVKKEGMSIMGSDINEVQNSDVAGMWVSKANTYASEFGYGINNNTGSAYTAAEPLKNGEMVLFAKNKFKPECCPAPYSTSTGCVCMTPEQINYLNTRGGNRTSDSGV
jgi:hypothetical protein